MVGKDSFSWESGCSLGFALLYHHQLLHPWILRLWRRRELGMMSFQETKHSSITNNRDEPRCGIKCTGTAQQTHSYSSAVKHPLKLQLWVLLSWVLPVFWSGHGSTKTVKERKASISLGHSLFYGRWQCKGWKGKLHIIPFDFNFSFPCCFLFFFQEESTVRSFELHKPKSWTAKPVWKNVNSISCSCFTSNGDVTLYFTAQTMLTVGESRKGTKFI